jgi:hypothetical protein
MKESEMGGTYSIHGREDKLNEILVGEAEE